MPVYRDEERKTWYVSMYYRDMNNMNHKKTKRGFQTKRDACAWELEFKSRKSRHMGKPFEQFWENYKEDIKPKLRASTWDGKEYIARTKLIPFFKGVSMNKITPRDILRWQNYVLQMRQEDGQEYSAVYYKTLQSQLSAIFNHAVRYYDLESNPVKKATPISGGRPQEFKFWIKEEYMSFIKEVEEPLFYYAFELLYWCGIREGELFALTKEDFYFVENKVSIRKTLTVVKGEIIINLPKTTRSIRNVTIPSSLAKELERFITGLDLADGERIFSISKTKLNNEFQKAIKKANVKRIRIHDLRHSHVSLLIHMGFSAVAIGERVGNKSERITYYYAHLFPGEQESISCRMDIERKVGMSIENSET